MGSGQMAISADAVDNQSFAERGIKKRPVASYLPLAQRKHSLSASVPIQIQTIAPPMIKSDKDGSASLAPTIVSIAILSILSFIIGSSSMHSLRATDVSTEMADYSEIGKSVSHPSLGIPALLDRNFLDISVPVAGDMAPARSKQQLIFWDVAMSGREVMEEISKTCFGHRAQKIKPSTEERAEVIFHKLQDQLDNIDIVITHYLYELADMMEGLQRKGKVFALLRHPVNRAHAVYYKLQELNKLHPPHTTFHEYVRSKKYGPHNFMVRFLTNKVDNQELNEKDLEMAMSILERKFVIGLWEDLPSSIERFRKVLKLGTHVNNHDRAACQMVLVQEGKKSGFDPLEEGTELFEILKAKNYWDMHLYDFARKLYFQQATLLHYQGS